MELIERYLQAVEFWLPGREKKDIIAELSEDIYAQVADRERDLGRKLTEQDIESLLLKRGRPVLVANGFQPRESFIGPVLFPIYKFVLKIAMVVYLAPLVATWAARMIYSPAFRADAASHWLETLGQFWSAFWVTAFIAVGSMTILFGILDRVQARSHFMEKWNPRGLPPLRNPVVITRASAVFELAINALFSIWLATMHRTVFWLSPDLQITLSPVWFVFYRGFLAVAIANTALAAYNLLHPYWTPRRAAIRLVSDMAGSALFCWLMKANVLAGFAINKISPERAAEVTNTIDRMAAQWFPYAVVICVGIAVMNAYKIVRLKATKMPVTREVLI